MAEHITATLWSQSEPLTERKLNRSTLSMPNALSCRMTGAKLERCISGTVEAGSFSKSSSDKGTAAIKWTGRHADKKRQGKGVIMNKNVNKNMFIACIIWLEVHTYPCTVESISQVGCVQLSPPSDWLKPWRWA